MIVSIFIIGFVFVVIAASIAIVIVIIKRQKDQIAQASSLVKSSANGKKTQYGHPQRSCERKVELLQAR